MRKVLLGAYQTGGVEDGAQFVSCEAVEVGVEGVEFGSPEERPIRQEEAISTDGCRAHQRLKQVLKGDIFPDGGGKSCADHASLVRLLTSRGMAYANIEAILDDGGDISVGRVAGECVAAASTSYDCPVMLVRRDGESFAALLKRLDRSIGKAWDNEAIIDEVNG
jgi:hypothetical protein